MAKLGSLEREVMERVWRSTAPVTVREVHDGLADRDLAYTTVMTVLDRLAKKGVVHRVREGRAYRYRAAASKDEMVADLMHEALDDAGSRHERAAALVRFVDRATPTEAAALRDALAALEDRAPDADGASVRHPDRGVEHAADPNRPTDPTDPADSSRTPMADPDAAPTEASNARRPGVRSRSRVRREDNRDDNRPREHHHDP